MPRFRPVNSGYRDRLNARMNQAAAGPKFEYLTEISGTRIIMTDHAKQQCLKRHGLPLESCKKWFADMANVWESVPVVEYNQEVFVYSHKYQRGMVLAYRRDFKSDRPDLALVVVTVYPYGKAVPMKPDTKTYRG